MYLFGLGLCFLVLKLLEVGPVAAWGWGAVLWPFGLTVLWWAWADVSGYTRRRAMDRMASRRLARVEKYRVALGTHRQRRNF